MPIFFFEYDHNLLHPNLHRTRISNWILSIYLYFPIVVYLQIPHHRVGVYAVQINFECNSHIGWAKFLHTHKTEVIFWARNSSTHRLRLLLLELNFRWNSTRKKSSNIKMVSTRQMSITTVGPEIGEYFSLFVQRSTTAKKKKTKSLNGSDWRTFPNK